MKLRLRPAVGDEVEEAAAWYEAQNPGLGSRFAEAFFSMLERIEERPRLYPVVYRETRRALFPRPFPYMVLFKIETDAIVVLAVLHQARDPKTWQR